MMLDIHEPEDIVFAGMMATFALAMLNDALGDIGRYTSVERAALTIGELPYLSNGRELPSMPQ